MSAILTGQKTIDKYTNAKNIINSIALNHRYQYSAMEWANNYVTHNNLMDAIMERVFK